MKTKKKVQLRSPLRFPGSKSKVLKKLHPFLIHPHIEYREPFVGGGAIFFGKQKAQHNWLNDKDENIATFLRVIQNNPLELCRIIEQTTPTIELWNKFRSEKDVEDPVELAFRFLFFNRTNYSGIYSANPIGGLKQQSQYKIDCRWNSETLCNRVMQCSDKLRDVTITSENYIRIIEAPGDNVFLMIDPPYYHKGSSLYPVYMTPEEHVNLADILSRSNHSFLLTIDDCLEVRTLYSWAKIIPRQWFYTVNSKKADNVGRELFVTNINAEEIQRNLTNFNQ